MVDDIDRPMQRKTKRKMANRESGYYTPLDAAKDLESRQNKVESEIKKAQPKPGKPKPKARSKPKATSLERARQTRHTGSEGETAFGQRMTPSPYARDE